MALSAVKEPLNTTQIHTKGQIYEISATLKAALEHRLKCEGYFEGNDMKNMSLYSITPRGRKLLKGWIAFYQPTHKITWQYGINPNRCSNEALQIQYKHHYKSFSNNYYKAISSRVIFRFFPLKRVKISSWYSCGTYIATFLFPIVEILPMNLIVFSVNTIFITIRVVFLIIEPNVLRHSK